MSLEIMREISAVTIGGEDMREEMNEGIFKGLFWQGIPERGEIVGQEVKLNGEKFTIEVVGFQGSESEGQVQMHEEPEQQENIFFIAGKGETTNWDGPGSSSRQIITLVGVESVAEAKKAEYSLALASDVETQGEHLVLQARSGGKTDNILPVVTRVGGHHATRIDEESLYFIVKMRPMDSSHHAAELELGTPVV